MTVLLDHEQRFADSPEGQAFIARERYKFETGERYKGDHARPWTDAMSAQAARAGSMVKARNELAAAHNARVMPQLLADAKAAMEAAKAAHRASLNAPRYQ